jgi:hypothetical protein
MRRFAIFAALALSRLAAANQQQQDQHSDRFGERLRQAEVVVVAGSADHMEQVLRRAQLKFVVVQPADLPNLPLHGQQVLMVNCTGEMSDAARERVRRFVTAGGFLYTTDHAVLHLLEKTFPGYIQFNHKTTNEQIFPMQVSGERGLIKHISATSGHPRWQLASGGYLFDIVNPQRVEVLMKSAEVAQRYGTSGALAVRFRVGDGQIIHATGHFFTQPGQRPEVAAAGQAFEQLSQNVVEEKKADRARLDNLYNVAPKAEVQLQAAPAPTAPPIAPASGSGSVSTKSSTKVRVLGHKGGFANVRDAEGNEGWVPESAL